MDSLDLDNAKWGHFDETSVLRRALAISRTSRGYSDDTFAHHPAGMTAPAVRRIALVAHDNMKPDLLEWAEYNRATLSAHELIGTGTTGRLVSERLGVPVRLLLSGPLGGDQQLGALIVDQAIDLLIFFWDPLEPQPHDPDVRALLRVAVVWNVPVACNRATADHLISSPLVASTYSPALPDYADHNDRVIAEVG